MPTAIHPNTRPRQCRTPSNSSRRAISANKSTEACLDPRRQKQKKRSNKEAVWTEFQRRQTHPATTGLKRSAGGGSHKYPSACAWQEANYAARFLFQNLSKRANGIPRSPGIYLAPGIGSHKCYCRGKFRRQLPWRWTSVWLGITNDRKCLCAVKL